MRIFVHSTFVSKSPKNVCHMLRIYFRAWKSLSVFRSKQRRKNHKKFEIFNETLDLIRKFTPKYRWKGDQQLVLMFKLMSFISPTYGSFGLLHFEGATKIYVETAMQNKNKHNDDSVKLLTSVKYFFFQLNQLTTAVYFRPYDHYAIHKYLSAGLLSSQLCFAYMLILESDSEHLKNQWVNKLHYIFEINASEIKINRWQIHLRNDDATGLDSKLSKRFLSSPQWSECDCSNISLSGTISTRLESV